jgi:ABC-2 type transport system permease protein
VLRQLRRDHRTVALLLVVPLLLLTLLRYVFDSNPFLFDKVGGALLALFPFTTMFLVTSVAMLRERTTGTLERLLTLPMAKADLLLGYALAFGAVALVQTSLASALVLGPLGLDISAPAPYVVVLAVCDALLGMALGLFTSAFARSEFQAVQFLPAFVFPQLLLCGLFVPRDALPGVLEAISNVLPLSYAVDAMQELVGAADTAEVWRDVAVVLVFALGGLGLGAATLRRRTP